MYVCVGALLTVHVYIQAKNSVSIVAGWAPGHGKVGISAPFYLHPAAAVAVAVAAANDSAGHQVGLTSARGSNATAVDTRTSAKLEIKVLAPENGTHSLEKGDVIKVPKIDISSVSDADKDGHVRDAVTIHIDHHHDSDADHTGHIRPPFPPGLGLDHDLTGHIRPPFPPGLGLDHDPAADHEGHIRPPGLGLEHDLTGHIRPPFPPGLGLDHDLAGHIRPPFPPGLGLDHDPAADHEGHIRPPGLGLEHLAERMRRNAHQHFEPPKFKFKFPLHIQPSSPPAPAHVIM